MHIHPVVLTVMPVVVPLTTLATAVAAVASSLLNRRKLATNQAVVETKIQEVHVLVNSRLTEALEKITRLENRIERLTGIPTPPDPIKPTVPG